MANKRKNQKVNLKIVTLPQSVNVTIQVPFTSLATVSRMRKEKKSSNMFTPNKHVTQLELFGTN